MNLRPDPTFHPSPRMAMEAPAETLAFTLMLSPDGSQPDGLAVGDLLGLCIPLIVQVIMQ